MALVAERLLKQMKLAMMKMKIRRPEMNSQSHEEGHFHQYQQEEEAVELEQAMLKKGRNRSETAKGKSIKIGEKKQKIKQTFRSCFDTSRRKTLLNF